MGFQEDYQALENLLSQVRKANLAALNPLREGVGYDPSLKFIANLSVRESSELETDLKEICEEILAKRDLGDDLGDVINYTLSRLQCKLTTLKFQYEFRQQAGAGPSYRDLTIPDPEC